MHAFLTHRFSLMARTLPVLVMICIGFSLCSLALARQEYVQINWDTLDLSASQRQHLNNLDHQWKDTVNELAPRIQQNQKKLKQLINSPKPDTEDILEVQQEIHEDKARLKMEATQIFLNKRKILNQEQRDRLQQMLNLY